MKKLVVSTAIVSIVLALAAIQLAPAASTKATASGSSTVVIDHFKFTPDPISIAPGTTVVFSNTSKVSHTATRRGSFDTGKIKPGQSVGIRFTRSGSYAYFCRIHPKMHGKIVVR